MGISETGTLPPPPAPIPAVQAVMRDLEKRKATFSEAARLVKHMPDGLGDEMYRQLSTFAWATHLAILAAARHQFPRSRGIA